MSSNTDFLNRWIESEKLTIPKPEYEALVDICESDIDESDVPAYCKIKKYPAETVKWHKALLDYAEQLSSAGSAGMSLVDKPATAAASISKDDIGAIVTTAMQYAVAQYEGLDTTFSSAFLEKILRPDDAQEVWETVTKQFQEYFAYPEVAMRTVKHMAGKL